MTDMRRTEASPLADLLREEIVSGVQATERYAHQRGTRDIAGEHASITRSAP